MSKSHVYALSSITRAIILGRKVEVKHVALLVRTAEGTTLLHAVTRRGRAWRRIARVEIVELGAVAPQEAYEQLRATVFARHRELRVDAEVYVDAERVLSAARDIQESVNARKLTWPIAFSCYHFRRDVLKRAGYPTDILK